MECAIDTIECAICLSSIGEKSASTHCCERQYHDECLFQWARTANTCPTCRKRIYELTVRDGARIHTVAVKDKLMPVDTPIPAEFIVPVGSLVCCLCGQAVEGPSVSCEGCRALYHRDCGVQCIFCERERERELLESEYEDYEEWPSGNRMERPIESSHRGRVSSRGRSRPSRITSRSSPLIIHNENDELDDDFLHSPQVHGTVLNGGVISRREQRNRQLLSPDERRSWDVLERVRNGDHDGEDETRVPDAPRRRRKKITPTTSVQAPVVHGRISGLISEMRKNRVRKGTSDNETETREKIGRTGIDEGTAVNESINEATSINEETTKRTSVNERTSERTDRPKVQNVSGLGRKGNVQLSPKTLSLNKKTAIQRIVRDRLRPLYNREIRTKGDFTRVNKAISHRVYRVVMENGGDVADMEGVIVGIVEGELKRTCTKSQGKDETKGEE